MSTHKAASRRVAETIIFLGSLRHRLILAGVPASPRHDVPREPCRTKPSQLRWQK